MCDSTISKIDRSLKHINELNELLREKRPFTYVVETNTKTGYRATFAKKNCPIVNEAANIAADVVHNLRTALDHAYWEIVSPRVPDPRARKNIQFPFSETAARLEEAIKNRLADRVSAVFFQALADLKPHGEPGGNELLYLIHKLDAVDKHKFPIPSGDYTRVNSELIRNEVADFPADLFDTAFGSNERDIVWYVDGFIRDSLGEIVPPTNCLFEKKLDVPVDIVFEDSSDGKTRPFIPTLYKLADVTRETIRVIRAAR
jgi:hypothetical protein